MTSARSAIASTAPPGCALIEPSRVTDPGVPARAGAAWRGPQQAQVRGRDRYADRRPLALLLAAVADERTAAGSQRPRGCRQHQPAPHRPREAGQTQQRVAVVDAGPGARPAGHAGTSMSVRDSATEPSHTCRKRTARAAVMLPSRARVCIDGPSITRFRSGWTIDTPVGLGAPVRLGAPGGNERLGYAGTRRSGDSRCRQCRAEQPGVAVGYDDDR